MAQSYPKPNTKPQPVRQTIFSSWGNYGKWEFAILAPEKSPDQVYVVKLIK